MRLSQTLMEKRIRPWINKKIVEYIGEEEATLVDFVCSKVKVNICDDYGCRRICSCRLCLWIYTNLLIKLHSCSFYQIATDNFHCS